MKKENNPLATAEITRLFIRLKNYQGRTKTFTQLLQRAKHNNYAKSTLLPIIPLAATALTPLVSTGQSCSMGGSISTPGTCNAGDFLIDVDGGGADFAFVANAGGLYMRSITGGTIASSAVGSYQYATAYAIDASISAGGSFAAGGNPMGGAICGYATSASWVLETSFGGGAGDWFDAGGGAITRAIGFKKDNKLGFIEVTWNNTTSAVSIGEYGLAEQTSDQITSIVAGQCATLPVELISFKAERQKEHILLSWETASEQNNAGFEVERSTDGTSFYKISWMEGVGQSQEIVLYEFEDSPVQPNVTYYYRLKQIDFDGRSTYSSVVVVQPALTSQFFVGTLQPNPARHSLTELPIFSPDPQTVTLAIYNAIGQQIRQQALRVEAGTQLIPLSLQGLEAANYFIRVRLADGSVYYRKLVVL
ncbi:MAG: T9SS type A sorting domain-containing protein [Bacteroidota bacterium]